MRLEINTFARNGDILDTDNKLVKRVKIGKGLSESNSVDEWYASLDQALEKAGYIANTKPAVSLPLTPETAIDRFTMQLEPAS